MPGAEIRTTRNTEEAFSALVYTLNEITIYCMLIGAISKPCRITGLNPDWPSMPRISRNTQAACLRFCFRQFRRARGFPAQPRNPAWF